MNESPRPRLIKSRVGVRFAQPAFILWLLLLLTIPGLVDPSRYNDAGKFLAHPHEMNVRSIVKSPKYPTSLAPAFSALEREGKLVPVASTDAQNLAGTGRIYWQRQEIQVVLLQVRP